MISTTLWVVGLFIFSFLIYNFGEIIAGFVCMTAIQKLTSNSNLKIRDESDGVPATFFPGGSPIGIIHKDSLPILHRAYKLVFRKLVLLGSVWGVLSVSVLYLFLLIFQVSSDLVYWCILFVSWPALAKVGKRGITTDKRLLGEIGSYLNQLYLNPFLTAAITAFVLLQMLRYFEFLK